jgi:heterodisulfide reductase subunit D
VNLLEILGHSMGLQQPDDYKRLKILQDADAIVTDCGDLIARHELDPGVARELVAGMLQEQPVPLRGPA